MSRVVAHGRIGKKSRPDSTIDAEYAAARRRASGLSTFTPSARLPLSPAAPVLRSTQPSLGNGKSNKPMTRAEADRGCDAGPICRAAAEGHGWANGTQAMR
jgi:hypothetical protein